MKRILIISLIIIFCGSAAAFAKDNKALDSGTIMLSGSTTLGFLFGNHDIEPDGADTMEAKTMLINLAGMMGYFVIDGLEVGPIIGFGYGSGEIDQDPFKADAKMTMFDFGAQVAYIYDMGGAIAPYGLFALEYVKGTVESTREFGAGETETNGDLDGFSFTLKPGAQFFITKRFSIDGALFFKYITGGGTTETKVPAPGQGTDNDFDYTSMNYGLMAGINVFIK